MMKGSVVAGILTCSMLYAQSLEYTFKNAKTEGYIRLGIQNHDQQKNTTDTAIGGMLKLQTGDISGIHAGIGFYAVQGFGQKHNSGIPFYDNNNQSYSLLGEAYLKGSYQNTTLKIGRQVIDTPFMDSDDIGMIPNLFEAYTLSNTDIPDTTILISQVQNMSGLDADVQERFTKINENSGVQMIGVIHEGIENVSLQAWYYHINNDADLIYLESGYEGKYTQGTYTVMAQYALQDYDDGSRANIGGFRAEISHEPSGLGFGAAYNKTDSTKGVSAGNFYGGGPFFTSSEHLTLEDAGANGDALMFSASFDAGNVGVDGLTLGVSHLKVHGDAHTSAKEFDLIANYAVKENLSVDFIFSDMKDKKDASQSFQNMRFFVNYRF